MEGSTDGKNDGIIVGGTVGSEEGKLERLADGIVDGSYVGDSDRVLRKRCSKATVVFTTLVKLKEGDWAAGSESNDCSLDASLGDRGAAADSRWLQITTMSTAHARCANIFLRGEEFRWTSREQNGRCRWDESLNFVAPESYSRYTGCSF